MFSSINFHEPDTVVSPGPRSRASLLPEARLTSLPSHHPEGNHSPSAFVISWEWLAAQPRVCDRITLLAPRGPPALLLFSHRWAPGASSRGLYGQRCCERPRPLCPRRPVGACTGSAAMSVCAPLCPRVCVSSGAHPRLPLRFQGPALRLSVATAAPSVPSSSSSSIRSQGSPASSLLTVPWLPSAPGLITALSRSAPMGPLTVCHPLPTSGPLYILTGHAPLSLPPTQGSAGADCLLNP